MNTPSKKVLVPQMAAKSYREAVDNLSQWQHFQNKRFICTEVSDTKDLQTPRLKPNEAQEEEEIYGKKDQIMAPDPISPMGQLRVRSSIPQFMKSLPSLPFEVHRPSESPKGSSSSESDIPTHLLFDSPGRLPMEPSSMTRRNNTNHKYPDDHVIPRTPELDQGSSPSKFRLRIKTSRSSLSRASPALSIEDIPERTSSNVAKSKFRMKPYRPRLVRDLHQRIHSHNPEMQQRDAPSEKENQSKLQDIPSESGLGEAFAGRLIDSCFGQVDLKPINGNFTPSTHGLSLSNQNNPRVSLSGIEVSMVRTNQVLSNKACSGDARDRSKKLALTGYRGGLRQKLSLLRLRSGGGSTAPPKSRTCGNVSRISGIQQPPEASYMIFDEPVGKGKIRVRKTRRGSNTRGGRVHRWAVEAKQAVRSYVRRTLDRSSSSED